mmetsp:Transcript_2150/g.5024  ORF Transcript_2150/g.5024 Transcript_2150/m.5024 type:complete len:258 (-) Transcript_2150:115-888(-)
MDIKSAALLTWLGTFQYYDASSWQPWEYVAWCSVIVLGLELMAWLVSNVPPFFGPMMLPQRGKHLDVFTWKDCAFIAWNKFTTAVFTYHTVRFCWFSHAVQWELSELNIFNTVLAFSALFAVYDFFYHLFHRALHLRSIYKYIHKHHHNQHAPTRGNSDAVNVHPFEFIVGEYLHLVAIALVPCHVITAAVFVVLGGVVASLNHTRYNLSLLGVFDVKFHDQHHVVPTVNYGQYVMLWDKIFGTYQEYPHEKLQKKA